MFLSIRLSGTPENWLVVAKRIDHYINIQQQQQQQRHLQKNNFARVTAALPGRQHCEFFFLQGRLSYRRTMNLVANFAKFRTACD